MGRWALWGWLVMLASVVADAGAADCPLDEKGGPNQSSIMLERPGVAAAADEVTIDRPQVVVAWLLRSCGGKTVVRLPGVSLLDGRGSLHRLEFVDESGKLVPTEGVDLTKQPKLVLLRSEGNALLPPGTHVALLRVQDAAGKETLATMPLRIKHTASSVPAVMAGASAVAHDAALLHRSQTVSMDVRVRPAAAGASWPILQVETLARRAGDTATVVEPLRAPAEPAGAASSPDGSVTYKVDFPNIDSPGRYDASLRLSAPGHTDQSLGLAFYVRDPAWLAFVFILLGVAVSYLIGRYGVDWRPRLVLRQRMSSFVVRLRAVGQALASDSGAQAEVKTALQSLEAAWNQAYARRAAPDEATLALLADIVLAFEAWPGLLKKIGEVQPATLSRTLREEVIATGLVLSAAKPDAEKVMQALAALSSLPGTMRARAVEVLKHAIEKLDGYLASTGGLPAAQADVARAQRELDAGQVDTARAAYDAAVLPYVNRLAEDLKKVADPAALPPVGVVQADWPVICKETQEALDALAGAAGSEARLAALLEAVRVYVGSCARSLEGYLADPAVTDAQRDAAKPHLATVRTELASGNAAAARVAYDKAVGVVAGAAGGNAMGPAAGTLVAFDALQVGDLPDPWHVFTREDEDQRARDTIGRYDWVLSLFVLFAASAAGIEAVWAKNPAWGGLGAYAAAFFFGLASDQFTKAGIAALRALKP